MFKNYNQIAAYLGEKQERPYPGKKATRVIRRGDHIAVCYQGDLDLAVFTPDYVQLDSGGWRLNTVMDRINLNTPVPIVSRYGVWTLKGEPFIDGVKLTYRGQYYRPPADASPAPWLNNPDYDPGYDDYVDSVYNEANTSKLRMMHLFSTLNNKGEVWYDADLSVGAVNIDACRTVADMVGSHLNRHIPAYYIRDWIMDDPNTKPAKVVASRISEMLGVRLPQEIRERMGQLLVPPPPEPMRIRISKGCDGSAEDYYHGNSCYWGCYTCSRDYVKANEGGAVRIYDPNTDELLSRCWYLPFRKSDRGLYGMVLFNAYGHESLNLNHIYDQAAVVAEALGVQRQQLEYKVGNVDRTFYLNSTYAFLVGSIEEMSPSAIEIKHKLHEPDEFWYAEHDRRVYCACCDNEFVVDDTTPIRDSNEYRVCHYCLEEYYRLIEAGSEWARDHYWHRDDTCLVEGDWYHRQDEEYIIQDRYGTWHLRSRDTWGRCVFSRNIYPRNELVEINGKLVHETYRERYEQEILSIRNSTTNEMPSIRWRFS